MNIAHIKVKHLFLSLAQLAIYFPCFFFEVSSILCYHSYFSCTITSKLPNAKLDTLVTEEQVIHLATSVSTFSSMIKVVTTLTGLNASSTFHKISLYAVCTSICSSSSKQRDNTLYYWLLFLLSYYCLLPLSVVKHYH